MMIHSPKPRQTGVTVVEILVAVALSLIILAGVMHIFINNKQTYRVQESFARLQESGRFGMHFITKNLRMAGYMGCGGKMVDFENLADYYPPPIGDGFPDAAANFSSAGIEGFQSSDLPIALTDTINLTASVVVPGTDIVRITGASTVGARVSGNTNQTNANVKLDTSEANGMFQQNDYLFISDCEKANIFVATGVSSNAGIITIPHATEANIPPGGIPINENNLSKNYQDDAEVYKFISNTYYIGYNAAGEPALYRQTLGNAATINVEELVEGVEDMQLLYGEDSDDDGTPNRYVDSATVADWNNIVSVRIELLVRSIEDNVAAKLTAFNDYRLRRTFTTSIAIRNRI